MNQDQNWHKQFKDCNEVASCYVLNMNGTRHQYVNTNHMMIPGHISTESPQLGACQRASQTITGKKCPPVIVMFWVRNEWSYTFENPDQPMF